MSDLSAPTVNALRAAAGVTVSVAVAVAPAIVQVLMLTH